MPRMLDLFAGRFGWGRAFAARGWDVVGIDLTEPPEIPHRCTFLKSDILSLQGIKGFDFICASSPCEQFSVHGIKMFQPNPPPPYLGVKLFVHTKEICEASGTLFIMENVRSAEDFVGPAVAHAGSFYLWGNSVPPLLPKGLSKGMRMDRLWCQKLGGHGTKQRNAQTAGFATIPPELANCVVDYAERLLNL